MHAQVTPEDSRLLHSIPPARVALIERIAQAAPGAASPPRRKTTCNSASSAPTSAVSARRISRNAHPRRWPGRHWTTSTSASERRPAGQSLVRVFNPDPERDGFESPHTVVMIVTDDMPFLVDSIGIVFRRAELAVHLIVHPVLDVRRDGRGRIVELGANGAGQDPRRILAALRDRPPDRSRRSSRSCKREIEATLADVRVAVEDWADDARARRRASSAELESNPPPLPADEVSEGRRLLEWMEGRHFVFLGYRHYNLERGSSEDQLVPDPRSGLGILRDGGRGTTRAGAITLRGDIRATAARAELLILTKANSTATVHRGEYLDYVGVKTFDARGKVNGEHRFLGLWTSTAYHRSPRDIPVLRRKVERVIEYFGLDSCTATTARPC